MRRPSFPSPRGLAALAALAAGLALPASPAAAEPAPYVPGEVIVGYAGATSETARAQAERTAGVEPATALSGASRVVTIEDGDSVGETVRELRDRPGVRFAVPNYRARASALIPNDPGLARRPAGWQDVQWNFAGPNGVGAPTAWSNLIDAGAPGGRGAVVAVVDSGVAYANSGGFRRASDFSSRQFVRGYDFVGRDTRPFDLNGHGTFVAGLIGEQVDNRRSLTGLAYGARIMPVRVLDADGYGDAARIAEGVRYAARHGADVINLSIEFDPRSEPPVRRAADIPDVASAVRYAQSKGALVVAAGGNDSARGAAFPARLPGVAGVGAVTDHGCAAEYSNRGPGIDLVAPGGGDDADLPQPECRPEEPGRQVFALTLGSSVARFAVRTEEGTSIAAPHVSATAALVMTSGVLGRSPTPGRVLRWLRTTSRDLGAPGTDSRYGAGLLDAARATTPRDATP